MRIGVGLLLSAAAAYALSFAFEVLLGSLSDGYPSSAYPLVLTWSFIATVTFPAGYIVAGGNRWLALPFAAFGALAASRALVRPHPQDYGVAALLLSQALIVWWLDRPAMRDQG